MSRVAEGIRSSQRYGSTSSKNMWFGVLLPIGNWKFNDRDDYHKDHLFCSDNVHSRPKFYPFKRKIGAKLAKSLCGSISKPMKIMICTENVQKVHSRPKLWLLERKIKAKLAKMHWLVPSLNSCHGNKWGQKYKIPVPISKTTAR